MNLSKDKLVHIYPAEGVCRGAVALQRDGMGRVLRGMYA